MKKKLISLLMLLAVSIIVNTNYVKAQIIIDGKEWKDTETWDKECKYTGDKGKVTLYIKPGKSMIIMPENVDKDNNAYIIYDGTKTTSKVYMSTTLSNKIIVNDNQCPTMIYGYYSFTNNGFYSVIFISFSTNSKDGDAYILENSGGQSTQPIDNSSSENCRGVISTAVKQMVDKYLGYVRIIVPIMILFLGVLDFAKAMSASKEDEMKKAQKRFVIRLVAGALVFLAPTIVNLIIDILNSVMVDKEACKLLDILQNYTYL